MFYTKLGPKVCDRKRKNVTRGTGEGRPAGVRKVPIKCHVLRELPIIRRLYKPQISFHSIIFTLKFFNTIKIDNLFRLCHLCHPYRPWNLIDGKNLNILIVSFSSTLCKSSYTHSTFNILSQLSFIFILLIFLQQKNN